MEIFYANFDYFGFVEIGEFLNTINQNSLKTIFCFDRMKLYEKEFLKY